MTPLVAVHVVVATLALVLGPVNLLRRPKGDRPHVLIGRVWVVAMYATIGTSFFIRDLRPGRLSWIHGLSVFTFVTVSIGLWAAMTGRIEQHKGFMRGSWFGVVGAFVGAVAVPVRVIPQTVVHHPLLLSAGAFAVLAVAAIGVRLATRVPDRATTPAGPVVPAAPR